MISEKNVPPRSKSRYKNIFCKIFPLSIEIVGLSADAGHLTMVELKDSQSGETGFLGRNGAVLDRVRVVTTGAAFGTSIVPKNRARYASVGIFQAMGLEHRLAFSVVLAEIAMNS